MKTWTPWRKDICDLAESYGRRTINDGRFIFGVRRIKRLIGLVPWVQDFGWVSEEANLDAFLENGGDAALFCSPLDEAFQRADVRKVEKAQNDTVSKAADPGKFKDKKKWPQWEPAFVNYLPTIQGVNGLPPLSYVVREQEEVDRTGTFESFNERTIACSPLKGPIFQADAGKVHQLLKSFLQTETAEQRIKPLARKQSGRADMIALRKHYSGEGNTSRRIADAEKIRGNLYYKNERAMQFSVFLDKLQRMFNIFEEENEEVSEQAKVCMLLKKVEHLQLQDAVGALRVRAAIEGISFTECANHIPAQVPELPDQHTPRKVSATESCAGKKDSEVKRIRGSGSGAGKRNGIHMPDILWCLIEMGKECDRKEAARIDAALKKAAAEKAAVNAMNVSNATNNATSATNATNATNNANVNANTGTSSSVSNENANAGTSVLDANAEIVSNDVNGTSDSLSADEEDKYPNKKFFKCGFGFIAWALWGHIPILDSAGMQGDFFSDAKKNASFGRNTESRAAFRKLLVQEKERVSTIVEGRSVVPKRRRLPH